MLLDSLLCFLFLVLLLRLLFGFLLGRLRCRFFGGRRRRLHRQLLVQLLRLQVKLGLGIDVVHLELCGGHLGVELGPFLAVQLRCHLQIYSLLVKRLLLRHAFLLLLLLLALPCLLLGLDHLLELLPLRLGEAGALHAIFQ